jgi:uncharacterized RDD family membrane protein YckC
VVTGEAVVLELRPAGVIARLLGGVVDITLYAGLAIGLMLPLLRTDLNQNRLLTLVVVASVLVMVVLPTTVETLTRGLSPGKLATGVRVVRDDGGPVRFRQAFVRALTGSVEIWMTTGGIAVITSILNRRSKRIGDLLAGTYAVRVRGTELAVAPLLMPPELAAWAAQADIRRLPDHLALHARVFLSRTGTLQPAVRDRTGRELAAAVEPLTSPPPPWGTHPERFLAAVLVARRDREYHGGLASLERDDVVATRTRALPYGVVDG